MKQFLFSLLTVTLFFMSSTGSLGQSSRPPYEKEWKKVEEFVKKQEKSSASDEKLNLEKNDLTAMILAVFSLILPYFLVFVGIMGLSVYLLSKFFV